MKKIKKILFIALSAFSIISCRDAIDIVQAGELNDEATFKTTSDLQKYLDGSVYTSIDISNEIKLSSVFTDELKIGPANAGQDQGLFRYILTPGDGYVNGMWLNKYTTINRVNRLLEAASSITPITATEQIQYNQILAKARTIRAFTYLTLEAYFTTNLKDDNALGVILSDHVPGILEQLPRVANSQIWALVEADLNFAEANLDNSFDAYYVSKRLVDAIRARMYLYRGNYTLAKQYALSAINGNSLTTSTPYTASSFYTVPSSNPYRRIWDDSNPQGENIFSLSRQVGGPGGNIAGLYTTNTTNMGGAPWWVFGLNLYSALTSNTTDVRRFAFIDPSSTPGVYVIDKYPGKGTQPLKNNIKVFRLSEMYLILAECEAQASNYVQAATYIKAVRDARKYSGTALLPVYSSTADALKDILKERRVELCFEGHRYVDLKRAGAQAGVSIDRNSGDDIFISSTPLTLPISDHRFTLPIPTGEINGNPSIVQNPGY